MSLDHFARRLAEATTTPPYAAHIAPDVFAAGGAGQLGEVGVALFEQWQTALAHATTEALILDEDLATACTELRLAAAHYGDVEREAQALSQGQYDE